MRARTCISNAGFKFPRNRPFDTYKKITITANISYISWTTGRSISTFHVVQCLLDHGADKGKANDNGYSPLSIAAQKGHLDVVQCLLEQGADKDKAIHEGGSPLYIAASEGHLGVVQCLLEQGADKDKATNDGASPLIIAAQQGHLGV